VIRPRFAIHVFQGLLYVSLVVTFNLLDSDMRVLARDVQCISTAVWPWNEIIHFGYPRFKNV